MKRIRYYFPRRQTARKRGKGRFCKKAAQVAAATVTNIYIKIIGRALKTMPKWAAVPVQRLRNTGCTK